MFVYIQHFSLDKSLDLSLQPDVHLSKTQLLLKQQELLLMLLVIIYQPSSCQLNLFQLAGSELLATDPEFTTALLEGYKGYSESEII